MKRVLLTVLVLGFAAAAAGHLGEHDASANHTRATYLLDNPSEAKALYNDNVERVPGFVQSIVSGERINIYIETGDGERVYGVVMNGAEVDTITAGPLDAPTLEVHTSLDTIESVATASNPMQRGIEALNNDEIRYNTVGFWRNLTVGAVSLFARVFAFF